ncbi:hypothetical protein F5146DRAFT_1036704 [Armillaria mellea]|nr:hypothetical protein F5146DRAFT_1036704 [Armillaria mellea]
MAGYHNVTIDNTQISDNLKYLGFWTNNGSYHTNTGESGTLSSTKDPTANVTFTFPEAANAFYYYGIRRPNFVPIDAVNRSDDGTNPPVVLYSKTFDKPGVHKVTLSNQNDTRFAGGNSQLTVASFVIQVEDVSASASVSSTASTASSSISATSSIAPEASQPSTTSKAPIGAIVGGVLGGIVAISLCFIIWFFMRRRHNQHSTQPEHDNTNASFYTSPYQYSPFIVPRTTTPTAYTVTDVTSDRTSRKTNRTSVVAGASVSNLSSGRTHPSSSRMVLGSNERLPRRETDAGRIDIDDDGDDLGMLPPGYEDIFSGHLNGERSVARGPSNRLPTNPVPEGPPENSPSGALGQPSLQPTKL